MSKRTVHILLSSTALILGGFIYVLLRENTYIAAFFRHIPLISNLQNVFHLVNCNFLKFHFPDFLWGFSLCCALHAVFVPGLRGSIYCCCIAVLCGAAWEGLQFCSLISGTGDWLDVVMYLFAGICCLFINNKEIRK